jgi:hypothetical protein
MIEIAISFDPKSGRMAVNSQAPPAVVCLLLELARGVALQSACQHMQAQASGGVSVPTPEQVRELVG